VNQEDPGPGGMPDCHGITPRRNKGRPAGREIAISQPTGLPCIGSFHKTEGPPTSY